MDPNIGFGILIFCIALIWTILWKMLFILIDIGPNSTQTKAIDIQAPVPVAAKKKSASRMVRMDLRLVRQKFGAPVQVELSSRDKRHARGIAFRAERQIASSGRCRITCRHDLLATVLAFLDDTQKHDCVQKTRLSRRIVTASVIPKVAIVTY